MSHDNSLLSKVGSTTIAALGCAVNTLLTPTTMGAEKFNIFVTIDNEKALEIGHFLKASRQKRVSRRCQSGICVRDRHVDNIDLIFRYGGETITFQEPIEVEKFCHVDYPVRDSGCNFSVTFGH
jgi:hypothetical protein